MRATHSFLAFESYLSVVMREKLDPLIGRALTPTTIWDVQGVVIGVLRDLEMAGFVSFIRPIEFKARIDSLAAGRIAIEPYDRTTGQLINLEDCMDEVSLPQIRAPFTDEQVRMLNSFQEAGLFHPFTCPEDHGPDDAARRLVAHPEGWRCPTCTYAQTWAHAFMADRKWDKRENADARS
jgi:hypothetical protein